MKTKIVNRKKPQRRWGLKAAILTMSFLQMATNAIAAVLADISAEFPGVSDTAIQYLMTFPNLFVVVMSVVTASLSVRIPKKNLAVVGLLLGCWAGIGSFFFHGSIWILYVWAGCLGSGIGLVIPVATSLISDYFEGSEKDTLLGYQTSAANTGSMLMTFFGGILAVIGWYYNYLVYLLAVPGLILTVLYVPGQNGNGQKETAGKRKAQKEKHKMPSGVWFYFAAAAVFMLLFYMGPTNLAMFVNERQIGDAMTAGTAASLLLLGGTVMGLIFGRLADAIGKNTIPLGFLLLAAGYFLICQSQQTALLYAGSFLAGSGNTLVLPQCMGSVVSEDKEQSTFLMSAVFSIANLGTFFAPVFTGLSAAVMGNRLVSSRFLFTGALAVSGAVLTGVFLNARKSPVRQ